MTRHILKHAVNICAWLTWLPSTAQDGTFDSTFNPGDAGMARLEGLHYAAMPTVYHGESVRVMAVQPDGKLLVGGWFPGGVLSIEDPVLRPGITRLNTDGSPDATFNVGTGFDGPVEVVVIQADGKILVAGAFLTCQGVPRKRIARLNSDGSLDGSFTVGTGADGTITDILVQPDTRIILGGNFTLFNGAVSNRIVRLLPDGSIDPSFSIGTGFNALVRSLALQVDGRILVGGEFTAYNGAARSYLVRLLPNGLLDVTYLDPVLHSGPNAGVFDIAVGTGGSAYVTGSFTSFNGDTRSGLKLDYFGAIDEAFVFQIEGGALHYHQPTNSIWSWNGIGIRRQNGTTGAGGASVSSHLQNGGWLSQCSYLIMDWSCTAIGPAGEVYRVEPVHTGIMRLDADLVPDVGFRPGTGLGWNPLGFDMTMDDQGRILFGGRLGLNTTMPAYNGQYHPNLVRLTSEGEIDGTFPFPYGFEGTIHRVRSIGNGRHVLIGSLDFSCTNTAVVSDWLTTTMVIYDENDQSLIPLHVPGCAPAAFGPEIVDVLPLASGKLLYIAQDLCSGSQHDIGRFNEDGSWDDTYSTTDMGWTNDLPTRALEAPDGKVYVVGHFVLANGIARNRIVRLLPNGGVDPTFDPLGGFNNLVEDIIVNPDGTVVCIGAFTTYRGAPAPRIAKLLPNGSMDPSFDPGSGFITSPSCLLRYPDGRILVGGVIPIYDGQVVNGIVCIRADGSIDETFEQGAGFRINNAAANGGMFGGGAVFDMELQPNGQVVCKGEFHMYDGNGRNRVARIGSGTSVLVSARVLLEGAYDPDAYDGEGGMLPLIPRAQLPLSEPYRALGFVHVRGGSESTTAAVMQMQGAGAIIDWVLVELRDAQDPTQIVATRSGLLRADGWIADMDGSSPLRFFGTPMGQYFLAVRHRNHLGIMSEAPVFLGSQPIPIDFAGPNYGTYGTAAQKEVGGVRMLWAGDVNRDGTLKYVGEDNDRDPILVSIGGNLPTSTVTGYRSEDINLDGVVKYVGEANDRDPILVNIGGSVPTSTRVEQLP